MKMLYFWVIEVTLATIPNTLSDLFQEASRCYSTEAEMLWILACSWLPCTHAAHPCCCHIPCPEVHYTEPQAGFFLHFHWHGWTGTTGICSSLWSVPQKCSDPASCRSSQLQKPRRPQLYLQKPHRPRVYLQPSIYICKETLNNVQVSPPQCFKQWYNWEARVFKWALYKHNFLQPSASFFCCNHHILQHDSCPWQKPGIPMSQAISQDSKLSSFHSLPCFQSSISSHPNLPSMHYFAFKSFTPQALSSSVFQTQRTNCGCPTHMD